jgi:hypothetical protein
MRGLSAVPAPSPTLPTRGRVPGGVLVIDGATSTESTLPLVGRVGEGVQHAR